MKAPDDDRTVHAFGDSGEVVRYERAGKWYFEVPSAVTLGAPHRESLTISQAAARAVWLWYHDNGSVNFGRSGGRLFDRRVREVLNSGDAS